MLTLFQAIILGIVQGVTEWLPISSSGHLVIVQELFGWNVPLFFDILLHLGTVIVICLIFWKDILKILRAVIKRDFKSEYGRLFFLILAGSLPTAFIGIIFYGVLESFFTNLVVVGIALIITGIILYQTRYHVDNKKLKLKPAFIIGFAQGLSIIPGISRSGATIGIGLLQGIDRKKLVRFSFLLSIPAVIGATIYEMRGVVWTWVEWAPVIVGTIVSGIVGYFSLKLLIKFVEERRLESFSWYCWVLGAALLVGVLII
jgi:undecaprenyl-diphosphatase